MKRTLILSAAILMGWLGFASVTEAQVFVRAPFVRVQVGGGGTYVRAPFVNLYFPPSGPVYADPPLYGPRVIVGSPPIVQMPPADPFVPPPPTPLPMAVPQPLPQVVDPNAPPHPVQAVQVPTHDAFAKSFQAKGGSYDVTMINPVTKQPTQVRFTLPEGTPRRVIVERNEIEFFYGLRNFVRIQFDRDGAIVTSR